jgi:hypothetical protein
MGVVERQRSEAAGSCLSHTPSLATDRGLRSVVSGRQEMASASVNEDDARHRSVTAMPGHLPERAKVMEPAPRRPPRILPNGGHRILPLQYLIQASVSVPR